MSSDESSVFNCKIRVSSQKAALEASLRLFEALGLFVALS